MKKWILIPCLFILGFAEAQVRLPRLVRDSMILQRDVPVNIWGWASPKEKISISFKGKTYKTTTNAEGKWSVTLSPVKAGGPYTMTISGRNKITISEILFGDVWFCSGQSNMVHQLNIHDVRYAKDILEANDPDIRHFFVPNTGNLQGPQQDLGNGYWVPAVGEKVRPFSAVAYFFAKDIHDRYHIPVGLINASIGGTPAEAWVSEEGLKEFSNYLSTIQKNKDTAYVNGAARGVSFGMRRNLPGDAGNNGPVKWSDPAYVPKGWRPINIPGFWEDQGVKDLNGIVWYRREIEIPSSMAGKPAKVWLGRIVDADELFINGKSVGLTTYQYPQRRYTIPAGVLKAGKNLFVIRVTNTNGKGGFVPDKPYCIFSGNDTIDLKGTWTYKVGEVYEPVRPGGGANFTPPVNVQNQPAALYNAMLAPVTPYNIKGVLWYQGEANTNRSVEYAKLLPALIRDWRKQWKQDSLPFLYPQLPGFMDYNYLPSESGWAELRESQRKTLTVPKTAMAVTIDLGEWNDIHPDNKKDVGLRLALGARKLVYGENIVDAGPLYRSAQIKNGKIYISFTSTGSGLTTVDGEPLSEFAIAGADKKFVWAKAVIEGDQVVVWNDAVKEPLYVRYAWADNPVNPNLCNKERLPASPFSNQ